MTTARLEYFSDGVCAIALLGVEIHLPPDQPDLAHELLALWPGYLAYALSFLLIGLIWANHHTMFLHMPPPTDLSISSTRSC